MSKALKRSANRSSGHRPLGASYSFLKNPGVVERARICNPSGFFGVISSLKNI
jgi:hypothetical protein